jgi:hypothetical protein
MFGAGIVPYAILMVLVDAHAIKTELLGVLKFVQIAIIKKISLLRIIVPVGQGHPSRRMFAFIVEIGGKIRPWHEVKEVELHRASCFSQRSRSASLRLAALLELLGAWRDGRALPGQDATAADTRTFAITRLVAATPPDPPCAG